MKEFGLSLENILNINHVTFKCHEQARAMGWYDKSRETGTLIALCHSELSEALEGHRKDLMDDHLPQRKMMEVELADCVIRIFDLAASMGYDLGGAIAEKLTYNASRIDHQPENRVKDGGKKF